MAHILRPFVLDQGRFVSFRAPDAPVTFPYDLNNRGQPHRIAMGCEGRARHQRG
jgi:hypothetical protein